MPQASEQHTTTSATSATGATGKQGKAGKPQKQKGGKFLPALCNVFGTLLLVAVIGLCVPLTVPLVMGYQVYDVVTGSMEPEIPVGSVVYVKDTDPLNVEEGQIIAYQREEGVIVHRVVTNRTSLGEFVTKGDANQVEDLEPIPYEAFLGVTEMHLPMVGAFMAIYASTVGKIYLLLTAACGVMFNMVASRMRAMRRAKLVKELKSGSAATSAATGRAGAPAGAALAEDAAAGAGPATSDAAAAAGPAMAGVASSPSAETSNGSSASAQASRHANNRASSRARKRSPLRIVRNVFIALLAVVFLGSGGVIGYVNWQYSLSDQLYSQAVDTYARASQEEGAGLEKPPITIDFDALCARNPDIIGWIYCPDTAINYPVLQGKDNDQYLHTDYTGAYNLDGSIFVDSRNTRGFVDANTIVYGHHMMSGSMFAGLTEWENQAYYDKHPVMWLLTPTQNYKVILVSGHHVDAYSNMYEIIKAPGKELDAMLAEAKEKSTFKTDAEMDPNGTYVMLSTCAYLWDTDRYVIHGLLTPAL